MHTGSFAGRRVGATALRGAVIAAMLGFAAVSNADAATVVFDGGAAAQVLNLQVGSAFYDVVFTGQISSLEWLSTPPKDFSDEATASAAATALATELQAAGATTLKLAGEATTVEFVQIPYSDNGTNLLSSFVFFNNPNWITGLADGTAIDSGNFPFAADFTAVAPVPLPAALPLFASALAGVWLAGWRRRKA